MNDSTNNNVIELTPAQKGAITRAKNKAAKLAAETARPSQAEQNATRDANRAARLVAEAETAAETKADAEAATLKGLLLTVEDIFGMIDGCPTDWFRDIASQFVSGAGTYSILAHAKWVYTRYLSASQQRRNVDGRSKAFATAGGSARARSCCRSRCHGSRGCHLRGLRRRGGGLALGTGLRLRCLQRRLYVGHCLRVALAQVGNLQNM